MWIKTQRDVLYQKKFFVLILMLIFCKSLYLILVSVLTKKTNVVVNSQHFLRYFIPKLWFTISVLTEIPPVIERSSVFLFVKVKKLYWTGFYWLISSPKCISINSHFHRWRGQPVNPAPFTSIFQVLHIYSRLCSEISAKSASNLQATQRNLTAETQESEGDSPVDRLGA